MIEESPVSDDFSAAEFLCKQKLTYISNEEQLCKYRGNSRSAIAHQQFVCLCKSSLTPEEFS